VDAKLKKIVIEVQKLQLIVAEKGYTMGINLHPDSVFTHFSGKGLELECYDYTLYSGTKEINKLKQVIRKAIKCQN